MARWRRGRAVLVNAGAVELLLPLVTAKLAMDDDDAKDIDDENLNNNDNNDNNNNNNEAHVDQALSSASAPPADDVSSSAAASTLSSPSSSIAGEHVPSAPELTASVNTFVVVVVHVFYKPQFVFRLIMVVLSIVHDQCRLVKLPPIQNNVPLHWNWYDI
jgi:hypothetical protein